jgi:hypothetical protein
MCFGDLITKHLGFKRNQYKRARIFQSRLLDWVSVKPALETLKQGRGGFLMVK